MLKLLELGRLKFNFHNSGAGLPTRGSYCVSQHLDIDAGIGLVQLRPRNDGLSSHAIRIVSSRRDAAISITKIPAVSAAG